MCTEYAQVVLAILHTDISGGGKCAPPRLTYLHKVGGDARSDGQVRTCLFQECGLLGNVRVDAYARLPPWAYHSYGRKCSDGDEPLSLKVFKKSPALFLAFCLTPQAELCAAWLHRIAKRRPATCTVTAPSFQKQTKSKSKSKSKNDERKPILRTSTPKDPKTYSLSRRIRKKRKLKIEEESNKDR